MRVDIAWTAEVNGVALRAVTSIGGLLVRNDAVVIAYCMAYNVVNMCWLVHYDIDEQKLSAAVRSVWPRDGRRNTIQPNPTHG